MDREEIISDLNKINIANNNDFVKKTIVRALAEGKVEMTVDELEGILPNDSFELVKFDAEYGVGKKRLEENPNLPLTYMFREYTGVQNGDFEILDDNLLDRNRHGVTLVGDMSSVNMENLVASATSAVKRDLERGLNYHKGPQDDILQPALAALTRLNVRDLPTHMMEMMENLPNMSEAESKNAILEVLALTGVRVNMENLGKVIEAETMANYADYYQDDIEESVADRVSREGDVSPEREAEIRKEATSEITDTTVVYDEYGDAVFANISEPEDQFLFDPDEIQLDSLKDMAKSSMENGRFVDRLLESETVKSLLSSLANYMEVNRLHFQESFVPRDVAEAAGKRMIGMHEIQESASTLAQSKGKMLGIEEQDKKTNKENQTREDEDGAR